MQAISYISLHLNYLIWITPVAAGAAATFLSYRKSMTEDEGEIGEYNRRIKHTIHAAAIIMGMASFVQIMAKYFK